MRVEFQKWSNMATIPDHKTTGAAGLDLYASEETVLRAGMTTVVHTGVAAAIPEGYVGLVWDRGSMAIRSLHVFAGVIDSDYRGEILVVIHNSGDLHHLITPGERIAQLLIQPVQRVEPVEVLVLEPTPRGAGRFGSTGR